MTAPVFIPKSSLQASCAVSQGCHRSGNGGEEVFKSKEFYFESRKIDVITPPLQTGRDISGHCDLGDIFSQ